MIYYLKSLRTLCILGCFVQRQVQREGRRGFLD